MQAAAEEEAAVLDVMLATWGDGYEIVPHDGGWRWRRRDGLGAGYAGTPDGLSRELAADHAFRPARVAVP